jgi:Holliday junction resolvase RusA-like endonuclease
MSKVTSEMITVKVVGVPVPKERPRFGRGHTYTPQRTKTWEAVVRQTAKEAVKKEGWTCDKPCEIRMSFFLSAMRGDLDNLQKSVLDAVRGVIVKDDSVNWITSLHAYVERVEKGSECVYINADREVK